MQRGQIQLQGIPFPCTLREQGASVELLRFDLTSAAGILNWAKQNGLEGDKTWGIIAQTRTREENVFLSLSFKKIQRTKLRLTSGRIEQVNEESTEPEIGEFHFRNDGILELYSFGAKQRTALSKSLFEAFGQDFLRRLYLQKDAMKSLISEAIEVSSISLTGLGNPFFNDAILSGTDPANSRTFKEMSAAGEIKSFRAKFGSSDSSEASPIAVTVNSSCKIRFFSRQVQVAQVEIEDFVKRVSDIAVEISDAA